MDTKSFFARKENSNEDSLATLRESEQKKKPWKENLIFLFSTHQMKATAKVHKVHKINYDV